jgi:NAD(P)H-flavin reductase
VTTTHQTVFLEGPYGTKTDLSTYSDVLVICGGSGITAAISHAHFLVAANTHTKVHVVWAVPQRQLPDDICAHELASVIKTDRCNMVVYLTAEAAEEVRVRDVGTLPRSLYEVRIGRPNIGAVMREYRRMATKNLAIVTCGTRQMSDVCRAAVVQVLGEEGVDTGYYNETLVW